MSADEDQSPGSEAGTDDGLRSRVRTWFAGGDGRLILAVAVGLYLLFTVVTALLGFDFNGYINTLRRLTFLAVIYSMLVLALNLQWGYAGLFNLGVAGFMAIGVYTMGILSTAPSSSPPGLGLPLIVGIIGGVVMATLLGTVAALPALRLRGDYLAIVTLAFAEIIRRALRSDALQDFTLFGTTIGTGGPRGMSLPSNPIKWVLYENPEEITSDPTPVGKVLFDIGDSFDLTTSVVEGTAYVAILVVILALFYILLSRIGNSPFGRVLKSIREDEVVARALGKDTRWFKVKTFALGAALMGFAGILWYIGSTASTANFEPIVTFYVFVALIIGGAGSNTGSVLGGMVFVTLIFQGPDFVRRLLQEYLEFGEGPNTILEAIRALGSANPDPLLAYTFSEANVAQLRFVLLGVTLIYLIQNRPEGLLGHRKEVASPINLDERGGEEQ